jgi:hypothetical protein
MFKREKSATQLWDKFTKLTSSTTSSNASPSSSSETQPSKSTATTPSAPKWTRQIYRRLLSLLIYLPGNPTKAQLAVLNHMQRTANLNPLSREWAYIVRGQCVSRDINGAKQVLTRIWESAKTDAQKKSAKVDEKFFGAALEVCASEKAPNPAESEMWFRRMQRVGVEPDPIKVHFLVESYIKSGDLEGARKCLSKVVKAAHVEARFEVRIYFMLVKCYVQ